MSTKREESSSSTCKRLKRQSDSNEKKDESNAQKEKMKKQSTKPLPPILMLSDEVLLNIMKYLNVQDIVSLGGTCQRMDNVTRDRTLWAKMNLKVPKSRDVGPRQQVFVLSSKRLRYVRYTNV